MACIQYVCRRYRSPIADLSRLKTFLSRAAAAAENWMQKCRELHGKAIAALGPQAVFFMERVADNDVNAPDYYNVIHPSRAMWLNEVRNRLDRGHYTMPSEFLNDMRQIWQNAKTYNPAGNFVRMAAERAESKLEEEWAKANLASERSRRQTAGQAPAKFDPELLEAKARPTASRGQAPSKSARRVRRAGDANTQQRRLSSEGGAACKKALQGADAGLSRSRARCSVHC